MMEIWPAILVTGVSFAIPQFLVSNYIGPELVDIIAAIVSMVCLVLFLRVWKPKKIWTSVSLKGHEKDGGEAGPATAPTKHSGAAVMRAWTPWLILTVFVFIWGLPSVKTWLNGIFAPNFPIDGLHNMIEKVAPVVPKPTKEGAVYQLLLLSATGTGILVSAIVGGLVMKYNPIQLVAAYGRTLWLVKFSLLTIMLMLALGTLTRYSGLDTTLGLAFANTGMFYPFFGTLMGWLGVALTGSDTASNVLFGGMQKVAADQLGLSPNLMGAANSSGGVMGKMIDAQSIVVASTATRWFNHEGEILRYVFFHSIALACLVGFYVTLQAYVWPFTAMVVK
jgi:lactate permease